MGRNQAFAESALSLIRRTAAPLLGALVVGVLPTSARAIAQHKGAAPGNLLHATGKDAADAILAESLNDIYSFHDRHFHEGEYNHIANLFRVLVQAEPWNLELYSNAAYLLWSSDQEDRAVAFLKQGLAANPNNYFMYDELGMHYLVQIRDYKSATPYYEKAVKFKCPATTWDGLAHCYEQSGQWDKAVHAWEKCAGYSGNLQGVAIRNLQRARQRAAQQGARKTD